MQQMNITKNKAVWFDIAVSDLDKARAFYTDVLGCTIKEENYGDTTFCTIENEEGNGGCLILDPAMAGDPGGILLYLNADGRIRDAVSKVKEHGGKVLEDVHQIGPYGCRAIVHDCCGNRIALHSTESVE